MWVFWIIVLVIIGTVLIGYNNWTSNDRQGVAAMLGFALYVTAIAIITWHTVEPKPTALDVYRGNTELKITLINGIPVDTVVVFKNK